jgi:hypothetical protein
MTKHDQHYLSNGDNEEDAEQPTKAEETVEGGRPLEDSPLIPGGATDDTTKNIAEAEDDPDGT